MASRHLLFATALVLGACAEGHPGPSGPAGEVEISVAPLSLPGVTNAVYDLSVANASGQVVWSRQLDARGFGDGAGSLSYVGPCDAEAAENPNTVTLTLLELYQGAGGTSLVDPSTYQNPGRLTRSVVCEADADVSVTFDISILRQANQGFFDVAVTFDEVYCSAKLDCVDDANGTIDLLFDGGQRARTLVMGLACTGGAGDVNTTLYRDDVVLDCGVAGQAVVDPSAGPGNLEVGAGISGTNTDLLFGAAVYRGEEQLGYNKVYWNVLLGLAAQTTGCRLTSRATATKGTLASQQTPLGGTWPVIDWNVTVTDGAGVLACGQHPVNGVGPEAGVATRYSDPDGPEPFSYFFSGTGASTPAVAACAAGQQPCDYASCQEILDAGRATGDGAYYVDPDGAGPTGTIEVWCDMTTDGGGWTLVARASDTNGVIGDYEFPAALGSRTLLGTTFDGGDVTDPQYTLGLDKLFAAGQHAVDIQYYCYDSRDPANTGYWVKAEGVDADWLLDDLAEANPDLLYPAALTNKDGQSTVGVFAVFGRDNVGQESCDNIYAGQSGMKADCSESGQTVDGMTWPSVWLLTEYPSSSTNYGEVASCGPVGGPGLGYYVGEVRIRFPDPVTALCAAGQQPCAWSSCGAILDAGLDQGDGSYYIDPDGPGASGTIEVYCDMTTDGGGWTLVARASDTNGAGGDYEFAAAVGAVSLLDTTVDVGAPGDAQYLLGLEKLVQKSSADVQYLCYDSGDRANTEYWVRVDGLGSFELLADLAPANPDFVVSGVSAENADGTPFTGNFAFLGRYSTGSETCSNSYAGQSGVKGSCAAGNGGQAVLSPPSVWMLTHYTGTYTEVNSCGLNAGSVLPYYVGEVRVR